MKLFSIFPSPVSVATFGEHNRNLNRELINDIEELRQDISNERVSESEKKFSWQSDTGLEETIDSFGKLSNHITLAIQETLTQVGYSDPKQYTVQSLWANVIDSPGDYSPYHIHGIGNVIWSGAYYPNPEVDNLDDYDMSSNMMYTDSPPPGWLSIRDPAKNIKQQVMGSDLTMYPYYGLGFCIKPQASLLVTFPSWLEHGVTPIKKIEEPRYSISFAVVKE